MLAIEHVESEDFSEMSELHLKLVADLAAEATSPESKQEHFCL